MAKYNKSDEPLKSVSALQKEIDWEEYEYRTKFEYICKVRPDADGEKLVICEPIEEKMNQSCVYTMVIAGKLFKIGAALRGMKGRIGSYNSGKVKYRSRGTNSVTNYWVLQSMIKMKQEASFYAFYPPLKTCELFGEKFSEPFPSAKAVEGIIIRRFEKKYGRRPIGCTQK